LAAANGRSDICFTAAIDADSTTPPSLKHRMAAESLNGTRKAPISPASTATYPMSGTATQFASRLMNDSVLK